MRKSSQSFLGEVRDQIKSKEAKEFVAVELDYHLKEAKNKWLEKGLDETVAEEKAVMQMGSPITLGQKLNKLHRPKVDWLMVMLLVTTMGLGFLPILFIETEFLLRFNVNASYFTTQKVIYSLVGGMLAFSIMLINYRRVERFGWLFYGLAMLFLVILQLSPNLRNGKSLLVIGPYSLDSLITMPFFLLAWASFFNHKKLKLWHLGLLFIVSFWFLLNTANLPAVYIYTVMVFGLFWCSRFSRKIKLTITGGIVGSFLLLVFTAWPSMKMYQVVRLLAFVNPEQYAEGEGYMMLLLQEHISKAGWFGNVLNSGVIPDVHADFVFAGFTYYFGWLAAFALFTILALFIVRIILIARNVHDPFGKLLLVGAVALYTVQLVSNIAMTLGLIPITSISLPFISYGLMPILLNAFIIGVVLSVYRRKDLTSMRSAQPQQ
ncbi:FtsW/RodA/SpoVE family cell cycle protein [Sporosarcina sp. FSL K6-2383]|uniref:FtsW/RodA/SpoVE family cell cycle protein n=1 Tax=Sporosarcina sp. FSL K6-2383 TaxID=2921556 RepID=UPI00315A86A3